MEEITGLPAAQMLGRNVFECFPHLRTLGVDRLIERALHGEIVTTPELRHEINGSDDLVVGEVRPAARCLRARDRRDRPGAEHHRAQTSRGAAPPERGRYRMLVEDAVDILYDTDVQGNIVAFKFAPAFEVLGLHGGPDRRQTLSAVRRPSHRDAVGKVLRGSSARVPPLPTTRYGYRPGTAGLSGSVKHARLPDGRR